MNATAAAPPGARSPLSSSARLGGIMLAPAIVYIVLLVGFPFLLSIYYSLAAPGGSPRKNPGHGAIPVFSWKMAGALADPVALGSTHLPGYHRLAVDIRSGLQRHQLDSERARPHRPGHLADLAGPTQSGHGLGHPDRRAAPASGGPYDTTQVLASLAFFTGVPGGDLAQGAAISLFLFPLLVAVVIVLLTVARRIEVT